jgi:hypothetical protein
MNQSVEADPLRCESSDRPAKTKTGDAPKRTARIRLL